MYTAAIVQVLNGKVIKFVLQCTISVEKSIWKGSICIPGNDTPFQEVYQLEITTVLDDENEFRGKHIIGNGQVSPVRGQWVQLEDGRNHVTFIDRDLTLQGFLDNETWKGEVHKKGHDFQKHEVFQITLKNGSTLEP
eukprot:UN01363